jgi:hypothetical protein
MEKQIILIIFSLIAMSCISQKREIISKSTIKLEGENTNIRDLIEIDGYYQSQDCSKAMFFEDGIYVSSFSFKKDMPKDEIKTNLSKSINSWIENKQVRWGFYWGVYKIEGDTLVVYYYLRGNWWAPWIFDEKRYKVIDRTTILPIYEKGLLKADEQYYKSIGFNPWIENGEKISFFPADSLPSSNCWLKEKKWIWRNESDWKAYMEKVKQIKKQHKKK